LVGDEDDTNERGRGSRFYRMCLLLSVTCCCNLYVYIHPGVVLRVDSPGGDALASDLMWREIRKLAEKKPVVACMGDVAASGGYYMSMAAQVSCTHGLWRISREYTVRRCV
jgi:hypothetical protein